MLLALVIPFVCPILSFLSFRFRFHLQLSAPTAALAAAAAAAEALQLQQLESRRGMQVNGCLEGEGRQLERVRLLMLISGFRANKYDSLLRSLAP